LKKAEDTPIVLFFNPTPDDKSSDLQKAVDQISNSFLDTFRFAQTSNPKVVEKFGVKAEGAPLIIVQHAARYQSKLEPQPQSIFHPSSSSSSADIASFLVNKGLSLAGILSEETLKAYRLRGHPMVKLYMDVDWEKNAKGINYYLNRLRKVASKFQEKLSFVVHSFSDAMPEAKDLGFENQPGSVAIIDNSGKKFVKDNFKFSVESLELFANEFLEGKMEPYIKSGAVPEGNDEADVKVVVAKKFKDIVMDDTKDVLLEAYAPWCGHCKSLEPKYNALGKEMKKYSKTLTIAKVDATANDLPPQYMAKGYPTIFFAPANRKDNPIKFNGDREVKDFVEFIKKNAFFPLDEKDEL